ncbi:MAG TPA: metallophosphoesterase [Longimicrobiales bacterium]|nr:metallophosphoesterase [Longimicrobiales bacterium]
MSDAAPGRTLVLGDVHGAARALEQVFERSRFDPAGDRLISLGDIADGWPDVDRCFDLLLDVPRLTLILGNHDEWAAAWMRGRPLMGWAEQGGDATVEAYARRAGLRPPLTPRQARRVAKSVPASHGRLLQEAAPYAVEGTEGGGERLFTHAGWNPGRPAAEQTDYDLRLGRDLWIQARALVAAQGEDRDAITRFDEVYLGHTPTEWRRPRPVLELWNLDQGAGWDGVLTLMDVETKEYWQSDPVPELYPGVRGRR